MDREVANTFDSIESAHEFVSLLAEAVVEAKREIDADVQRESSSSRPRRVEALRVALYSLQKLETHMTSSRRILNDLRSLRRLLFEERTPSPKPVQAKPIPAVVVEVPAKSFAGVSMAPTNGDGARSDTVAAA